MSAGLPGLHVYAPPPVERLIRWDWCQDCQQRSPLAFLLYEWHGPLITCMRCGREHSAEGQVRAPLLRNWREINKAAMRLAWKRAPRKGHG